MTEEPLAQEVQIGRLHANLVTEDQLLLLSNNYLTKKQTGIIKSIQNTKSVIII